MRDYLEELTGIKTALVFGGLAGSIIAASLSKVRTFPEALISFISGFSISIFAPAWIEHFFWEIPNPSMYGGLGFGLGLLGMKITLHIYQAGSRWIKTIQVGRK